MGEIWHNLNLMTDFVYTGGKALSTLGSGWYGWRRTGAGGGGWKEWRESELGLVCKMKKI